MLPISKSGKPHSNRLDAAVYITSGIRGMERGAGSMDRDKDGNDVPSDMELLRLPRRRRE